MIGGYAMSEVDLLTIGLGLVEILMLVILLSKQRGTFDYRNYLHVKAQAEDNRVYPIKVPPATCSRPARPGPRESTDEYQISTLRILDRIKSEQPKKIFIISHNRKMAKILEEVIMKETQRAVEKSDIVSLRDAGISFDKMDKASRDNLYIFVHKWFTDIELMRWWNDRQYMTTPNQIMVWDGD